MASEEPPERPKRDTSSFDRERAARVAVIETAEKLSAWQQEIARLRLLTVRTGPAEDREVTRRRCEQLRRDLDEAVVKLLETTPEELRSHSRIVDMKRAIAGARAAVTTVEARLD